MLLTVGSIRNYTHVYYQTYTTSTMLMRFALVLEILLKDGCYSKQK